MAIVLKQRFSVDLGNIVRSSLEAVKSVRRSEQAKKEAEFQRAIADGLSYEEQLALREKQLEDAKAEGAPDADYISKLEESIAGTKKLNRFNNYRTKYAESLGELSSGKINEEDYLKTLKGMLSGVSDPELRLEIQGDITAAEGKVKTYRDTILDNRVRKAKYDGTQKALKDAVKKVKAARSEAALNDNEDEVTAYDETLAALGSQLSAVKIQDSLTDFQVQSATRGTNPIEKLNYINEQAQNADAGTQIKIGDRTYESAAQFWSLERDNYLAGSSQIFGKFFDELEADTKSKIAVNTAQFGFPTQVVLDASIAQFNELRARPEVAPFVSKLDITQAVVMSEAVDKIAKKVIDVGTSNLTFKEADAQLLAMNGKYGIDTSAYRLDLEQKLVSLAQSGIVDESEAANMAPNVEVALPTVNGVDPVNPSAPVTLPSAPAVPGSVPVSVPTMTPPPVTPAPITPPGSIPVPPPPSAIPPIAPGQPNQSKEPVNQSKAVPNMSRVPAPVVNQSKAVPNQSMAVPNQSKALPPANAPQPPKQPNMTPAKQTPPKPVQNKSFVPPNYTPSSGIGTKSVDGNFQFTKEGWKPIR